jgi:hypothetical protein
MYTWKKSDTLELSSWMITVHVTILYITWRNKYFVVQINLLIVIDYNAIM